MTSTTTDVDAAHLDDRRAIVILSIGIFAMVTSEFVVAGLMPQLASGLDVSTAQVGYLITAFAAAMAFGGPALTVGLLRMRQKRALMVVFAIFLIGNLAAALAPNYAVMLGSRIVSGAASQAFFGVAISMCARLSPPAARGRAIATVMNGLMLGTLLGLPMATFIGGQAGWRVAFAAIGVLTVIAAFATLAGVPDLPPDAAGVSVRGELGAFAGRRIWWVLATSTCVIGATFAAFSYFTTILTEATGFSGSVVPLLLVAYGAATVIGNIVVGRLADAHAVTVVAVGLIANAVFLAGFAVFVQVPALVLAFMLGIGLVGVTMNPAMVTRVHRAANAGPLVNTVHSSFITGGIIIGSSAGGLLLGRYGLTAPLWLGVALAVVGLLTLLPELRGRGGRSMTAPPS